MFLKTKQVKVGYYLYFPIARIGKVSFGWDRTFLCSMRCEATYLVVFFGMGMNRLNMLEAPEDQNSILPC
jgi:hypothetical protein